jgi:hypothetical protein
MIDDQADRRTGLQVQMFKECGWDGQHDRAADLAQFGCVHDAPSVR